MLALLAWLLALLEEWLWKIWIYDYRQTNTHKTLENFIIRSTVISVDCLSIVLNWQTTGCLKKMVQCLFDKYLSNLVLDFQKVFLLKSEIYMQILNTKPFLCDPRGPRDEENKMRFWNRSIHIHAVLWWPQSLKICRSQQKMAQYEPW